MNAAEAYIARLQHYRSSDNALLLTAVTSIEGLGKQADRTRMDLNSECARRDELLRVFGKDNFMGRIEELEKSNAELRKMFKQLTTKE